MIKVIVVDDEWYNLEEISDLINETGYMEVTRKYQNPIKALEEVDDILPEVAFIDISMPQLDGLALAEKLLEKKPQLVIAFITSWNQFAVQAFDLNAIDYIMKPIKLERFNKMTLKIQKEVLSRREKKTKELRIKCFERLEASIGGVPVKWERSKAEELFAYLLINHDNYVCKNAIIEQLWSEYEPKKALQLLQTSVCRIRSVFATLSDKVVLNYSGNRYCLMVSDAICDLFEVEQVFSIFNIEDLSTYYLVNKAVNIYGKGFLSQQGYLWSMEKDEEIRRKFIFILNGIIEHYQDEGNHNELINYMKMLATLTPYDDALNYRLILILKQSGNENEAYQHYQWLRHVLKMEYDVPPTEMIERLFR